MSLIKRAYFAGERDGEPLLRVIRPGERDKTAGAMLPAVQAFTDRLTPDPRYTYVLVNAMGYSEFYGQNSNRDYYGYNPHLDFNGLLHMPPGFGDDPEVDRMQGKDWPYGFPTYYGATVFAHHKNTDPQQLGFGDVIFVAANPVMKRTELVKRVFNEEAQKKGHTSILERIANHERVDVSMGCKVPFDFCTICTDWAEVKKAWKTFDPKMHRHPGVSILHYHKNIKPIRGLAITRKDYCPCMLERAGKILPDGRKVGVYNDFPRFFDISFVWIGADRTARVMWYLGESKMDRRMSGMDERRPDLKGASIARLLDTLLSKTSAAKLAAMEKEIPEGIATAVQHDSDTAPDMSRLFTSLSGNEGRAKKLLTSLAALGIMPTPTEFQGIVLSTIPGGDKLAEKLAEKNVTFDPASGGVDDTFAADPGHYDQQLTDALVPLMSERSAFAPFLSKRMQDPSPKTASAIPQAVYYTDLFDKLASQYNGLRISVFENAPDLMPKAAAFLGPDVYLQEKSSGIGVAALLLGLGPVISLLSSHLNRRREEGQQLGSMAQFVADNPTFTSMVTIGAGLRAAMLDDEAGGLVQAAKSIVTAAKTVV